MKDIDAALADRAKAGKMIDAAIADIGKAMAMWNAADDRIDRTARPYRGDYYDHQIRSQEAFAGLLSALRESDGWTLFTMIGAHLAEAGVDLSGDRKSTRLNSSHYCASRMPSSAWKKK